VRGSGRQEKRDPNRQERDGGGGARHGTYRLQKAGVLVQELRFDGDLTTLMPEGRCDREEH